MRRGETDLLRLYKIPRRMHLGHPQPQPRTQTLYKPPSIPIRSSETSSNIQSTHLYNLESNLDPTPCIDDPWNLNLCTDSPYRIRLVRGKPRLTTLGYGSYASG